MADYIVTQVLERIKHALPHSKIAVFTSDSYDRRVFSVFASTVKTRQLLAQKPLHLIGVFCKDDNINEVETLIRSYLKPSRKRIAA